MFTSFNSVSVCTVHTLEEQARLRRLLEEHQLEYDVSVKDPNALPGFAPVVDAEQMLNREMLYEFSVYKKDVRKAVSLLEKEGYYD
ncbi:hypothetical protein H9X85_07620 [Anaerotignum lactatifermentans]|uniref:DUF2007 domain-containing protein n=1 Tax=Anaerotignum lactatifermentans TaxID=160404 RepID=A0ABS2G9F8_9FIRM|nr:hypothetical protein [Anaerotignum lactatifermentans]MBM6829602.1 hypothetical protein [Anaerotignum lactatifermentans]MBM6878096.1 hypothetical protein [Anaerotignum lactatifermentans]MBM6951074.1 hypothetical protein [Anaerotignum lactatifermentans]